MNIVTLMDFRAEPYLTMCKSWIYLAKRFNPKAHLYIGHDGEISEIKRFAKRYDDITFIKLSVASIRKLSLNEGRVDHPAQELQLALWPALEQRGIRRFLYVDADAFIVSSLESWWKIMPEKPFIATLQKYEDDEPLFNMGVFSYYSTKKFISLDLLVQQYKKDAGIVLPLGGQGLVNSYVRAIGYSPIHAQIGFAYNCFTKNCDVERVDDDEIVIYSGGYSRVLSFYKKIMGTIDWWEDWLWWNRHERVKILHGFGPQFKFWLLPECKTLWEYCKTQVA